MPRGRILTVAEREKIVGLAAEAGVSRATVQRIASKAGYRRRKTPIARTARPDAKPRAKGDVPEAVLVDAYLAACEEERLAVNGDRAAARERVLEALDRWMGRR